jgi:hypothetical protein
MKKIRLIKVYSQYIDDYESVVRVADQGNWIEISDADLEELHNAVHTYNTKFKKTDQHWVYIVEDISNQDNFLKGILDDHSAFIAKVTKKREKELQLLEERKKERAEKLRDRKLKQLEKLKKELNMEVIES